MIEARTVRPYPDLTRPAIVVTLVLLVAHLWAASRLEFMFDEAYYSLWARHLAWGYHDHPPGIAAWIRASTSLFGTSEAGTRALGALATAAGSLAIYLIALDLFGDKQKGLLAALLWNACPLIGVGAILVTPDTPLMFGWTMAVWALARLYSTGDWRWWLVVGFAAGMALEAKYTALFLGPGILLAMLVMPEFRRWWRHPAPYIGGLIALAIFVPNIIWNARHGWQTFVKQFGRVAETEWTLRFAAEFLGSQIGLLNPLTFVLVVLGFIWAVTGPANASQGGRRLLAALSAPLLLFLTLHSLHDRVQGNWLAPLYPGFALLAADAADIVIGGPLWVKRLHATARLWAVPLGLILTAAIYLQALFAPWPLPPRADPTALLSGWRDLARDVDALAGRENASYVLTQGYALTGLLKVYNPAARPVLQFNERQRWSYDPSEPQPDKTAAGLYIVEIKRAGDAVLRDRFGEIREIARLDRRGHGVVLESYAVYRVFNPTAAILDPLDAEKR